MTRLHVYIGDLGVLHALGSDGQGLGTGGDFLEKEATALVGDDGLVGSSECNPGAEDRAAGLALHAALDGAGLGAADGELSGLALGEGEDCILQEELQRGGGLVGALHGVGAHALHVGLEVHDVGAGLLDESVKGLGRGLGGDIETDRGGAGADGQT